jgi:3-oxoacyl-(acyl-carrier-protein) synthase
MELMIKGDFLITGLGSVSAAGENLESALVSVGAGARNYGPVSIFQTSLSCPVFEYRGPLDSGNSMAGGRTLALLVKAVDEALLDSGLHDTRGLRIGVCIGTTVASQLNDLGFYRSYRETGTTSLEPVDLFLKGNPAEFLSQRLGTKGPALTIVNACSSGTDAIGAALSWLKSDLCDIAIAGGADELSLIPYAGFSSLGILNPGLCAPFDRDRKGLNLGEGAGVMIIEKRSSAISRGVIPSLFLAGYGLSSDAYHLTAPSPEGSGLKTSIQAALSEAFITPEEISFVNAHGTGTQDNDQVEGRVLAEIFGPGVTFLSTKGYTGHTLGAAGGIEGVFTAAGLREGWIPASAGFCLQDDNIPVSPVMVRTEISGRYSLSTSLAFGGNNAAVVIGLEGR